jgi:hypothetical protein
MSAKMVFTEALVLDLYNHVAATMDDAKKSDMLGRVEDLIHQLCDEMVPMAGPKEKIAAQRLQDAATRLATGRLGPKP